MFLLVLAVVRTEDERLREVAACCCASKKAGSEGMGGTGGCGRLGEASACDDKRER